MFSSRSADQVKLKKLEDFEVSFEDVQQAFENILKVEKYTEQFTSQISADNRQTKTLERKKQVKTPGD